MHQQYRQSLGRSGFEENLSRDARRLKESLDARAQTNKNDKSNASILSTKDTKSFVALRNKNLAGGGSGTKPRSSTRDHGTDYTMQELDKMMTSTFNSVERGR